MKSDIQDERVREYLLGQFTPEDGERLEERLLTDGEFYQELLAAEDELVDEYVAAQLSDSDTRSFETYFLATPERQQKLRFARSLNKYIKLTTESRSSESMNLAGSEPGARAIPPVPPQTGWWARLWLRPILSYSLAAAAVLVLAFVAILIVRNMNPGPPSQGKVLAVELVPGLSRGDVQLKEITLTPDTTSVQFQLRISNDLSYQTYRAILQTSAGDEISHLNDLRLEPSSNDRVICSVSTRLLTSGDYSFKLSGLNQQREFEDIARYTFRVRRN